MSSEEGCALLIGERKQSKCDNSGEIWQINLVWPCCNIWQPGIFNLDEPFKGKEKSSKGVPSKENRFAIDPTEQLAAQRWAREGGYEVLGSAHSHPNTKDIRPSEVDLMWSTPPCLMVIVNKNGCMKAWWIENNKRLQEIKINC